LTLLLPLALHPAVGFGLSNNTSPFVPIYHQFSPSSHSQHLKISFHSFYPSFPESSSSSRPFQFLSEDLFGHPILLHCLQVTQPTYPLPLYPFYYIFSFIQLFYFSILPTFPFPNLIFRTIYSSKHFPFKNKKNLFFFLRHRPCSYLTLEATKQLNFIYTVLT
jgi:hypothetical protein